MAGGGDNFWPEQTGFATLDSQDQAFIQYLQEEGTVNVTLDGRIATTNATTSSTGASVDSDAEDGAVNILSSWVMTLVGLSIGTALVHLL